MIFNSIAFCVFFLVVFFVYYFPLKETTKGQNWLLLLSSYFFYGYADWRILPLLMGITVILLYLGKTLSKTTDPKKSSLITSLGVLLCLGLLVYFKYVNFFIDSFSTLFSAFGIQTNSATFSLVMPLGISFFTFKLISYIVEIQRKNIMPCTDIVAFSTYVAFFPTLLSGPIDKPNTFIPQIQKKRSFDYNFVTDGSKQILWGVFQKVVIADNLAASINFVWSDISIHSGSTLIICALLYSVQLYADFSGYSNMAIGVGKLLGFQITKNFNYPYFSRNVAEYWRNWHISLTSWLTDYVFMPLNIKFRAYGSIGIISAILLNMLAVGLWHGANWTFVVFGLYHGILFIPLIVSGSFFKNKKLEVTPLGLPPLVDFLKMIRTFLLITIGLIIFKATSMGQVWDYLNGIVTTTDFFKNSAGIGILLPIVVIALLMFVVEWFQRNKEFPLMGPITKTNRWIHVTWSWILIVAIVLLGGEKQTFIYFQF